MKNLIIEYVRYEDIDLIDKLDNMYCSEISEEIFEKCMEKGTFKKIEEKVWELMNDKDSEFSKAGFYDGLSDEDESEDEHDMWSACLYNCDLLYMTAIAYVLGLEVPEFSWDVENFGM
jgi:hypothetical protein